MQELKNFGVVKVFTTRSIESWDILEAAAIGLAEGYFKHRKGGGLYPYYVQMSFCAPEVDREREFLEDVIGKDLFMMVQADLLLFEDEAAYGRYISGDQALMTHKGELKVIEYSNNLKTR